jgi:hypothetical protein
MTDDTPKLKAVVENYVYIRTGKRIKIVFDDPQSIRKHLIMLGDAYSIAVNYKKTEQTFNNKE